MGNLSRKAALGIAALFTAATAATAVAGVASATPAPTMAPTSRAVSAALAAPAAPTAPAPAKAPAAPAAASWYWPLVQRGDRSVKVVNVQCLLRQWLGAWLPCNTRFTWATEQDVKSFQWRHGLYPSGKVGPETWSRLIITIRYGSPYNLAVLAAQASLRMAYRYPIAIDGVFGPRTLWAVKDFQQKYGLRPDGIVGPSTWNKMARFEW